MYVVRMVWHFQNSAFNKARQVFTKIQPPQPNKLRGARAYESYVGTDNTLALEWDFDSLADWEEFLPQLFASPENAEYFSQWPDVTSATTEIWRLAIKV